MSTLTATPPAPTRFIGLRRLTITEARLFGRAPGIIFWSAGFPVVAMIVLACIPATARPTKAFGGASVIQTYEPIIIAFSLIMIGVNFLPATIVGYREKGILRRLSTTPVSPITLLGADLVLTACVQAIVTGLVVGIAATTNASAPRQGLAFAISVVLSAAAVDAVGLWVTAICWTAKAANVLGTLLVFVLMFFSGLWLPRTEMTSWLRGISDATPMGSGVQALQTAAAGDWPHVLFLGVLAAYAVVGSALAVRFFRWE